MRDPNRIIPVLDPIRQQWEQHPDLRLGQLIVTAVRPRRPCPEVFSAEDDRIVAGLSQAVTDPPAEPGKISLTLTKNEAIILAGFLARFEANGRLAVPDAVEAELLSDVFVWLTSQLGPVFDRTPVVASAKAAIRK